MKIQESAENYLETILILQQRIGEVRSIDVVNELKAERQHCHEKPAECGIGDDG